MATVSKGYTFGATEQVTNTKLHTLVDSATVTNIVSTDMASSAKVVFVGASAPASPTEGQPWFDTSPGNNQGILRIYDGAQFRSVAAGFLGRNNGVSTIAQGAPVKVDTAAAHATDGRVDVLETTAKTDAVVGVALTDITAGSTGPIIETGKLTNLRKVSAGDAGIGDPVLPSATAGFATAANAPGFGPLRGGDFGVWTNTIASGVTVGQALIFPQNRGSSYYLLGGATLLFSHTTTTTLGSFVDDFVTWTTTPSNLIARVVRIHIQNRAGGASDFYVALRDGDLSTNFLHVPCSHSSQSGNNAGGNEFNALTFQGIVPGSSTTADLYLNGDVAVGNYRISIWEVGLVCGGQTL